MTEPILDFDLDVNVPYDLQFHHSSDPNYLFMPVSQRQPGRDLSNQRHYLAPGSYLVSLSYDGAESCLLRFQAIGRPVAFPVMVPAGTAGTPRTSDLVKISVTNEGEYLDMFTTPRTSTLTDKGGRALVSVFPSVLYEPEISGGGGFLGSFFAWLGGQSDRTHRLYRPGFRDPRILLRTRHRRNLHASCRGISHPRSSTTHPRSATSSRIKKSDDHLEWGGRGPDSNHELSHGLGKPVIHRGHNSSRAAWSTPVNHAPCKHRFKPLSVRESRGVPICHNNFAVPQAVSGDASDYPAGVHRVGLAVGS